MIKTEKNEKMQGFGTDEIQEYEIRHRRVARKAAAEGMVLLKNENHLLPLSKGKRVALFGAGAVKTVKGGTGSGDVNERESISIMTGMENAGFRITSKEWLEAYEKIFSDARNTWKDAVLKAEEQDSKKDFFAAYSSVPFRYPAGDPVYRTETDTAIYVIARISGEGADRKNQPGDYMLSAQEEKNLESLCEFYDHVVIILNTGGLIDLSFLDHYSKIESVIYIVQPGMEGGPAAAELLCGEKSPSGKLTDTWALNYEDYPSSAGFSGNDGDPEHNVYREGIYVGYRYFDTFEKPVRFGFGYGLSYTNFSIETESLTVNPEDVSASVQVCVKNTGSFFSGREVIQIYASCPEGKIEKEYRRLVGFAKTKNLRPGETEILTIRIPVHSLTSYDEVLPGWILEKGWYIIWAGNSLLDSKPVGMMSLKATKVLEYTVNVCAGKQSMDELTGAKEFRAKRYADTLKEAEGKKIPVIGMDNFAFEEIHNSYNPNPDYVSDHAREKAALLTDDQLILMVTGDIKKGQGSALGSAGVTVPGSAGETSDCAGNLGIRSIILADGPAGLRLDRRMHIVDQVIQKQNFKCSIENGFFSDEKEEGEIRYQYCTAFPVGTLIAQSWDINLAENIGQAVAEEMKLFGVSLWLAPGMNIHRNPLCGRNFEYYSEDPLLSGKIAAAVINGVQSIPHCGTTIKHFACNNAEDDRMGSNSILSERTLREIYLKGFEIAVKEAQPEAIMTSYNLINGIHSANNRGLCTDIARNEWHFKGIIMTDWCTTTLSPNQETCTASGCIESGNDLVMPGAESDQADIRNALLEKRLDKNCLRLSAARIINYFCK